MKEIKKNVFYIGVQDWDRRLFDELIPLPDGTSYNSYLIIGNEKIALIDTVDPSKESEFLKNLKVSKIERIDYIISNHAEQDHSGLIPKVVELYPEAKIIANKKGKEMLIDLLQIPEDKFIIINDGEKISLGGKTLEFIFAPWVHWPETMLTYLLEDKILFTCDLFGSHLATSKLFAEEDNKVYEAAKRYYAEIMMPFRANIRNHLKKIENYEIDIIAPSHGPVYNKPNFILNAYKEWISDNVREEVILPFISMHGSTRAMVEYFIDALIKRGMIVKPFNLTKTDIGELAISLVDASTMVIASPTVLTGPHPHILSVVYLVNLLRPKLKYFSVIGSYGWGGRMFEMIKNMLTNLKVEIIEPVIIKGYPKENDFKLLDKLADEIINKNKKGG